MRVNVYAFLDVKTNFFLPPMFFHNTPDAMRGVIRMSKNEHHPISEFPEDYQLFRLADYDDTTGHIKSLEKPERIATVQECLGHKPTGD